MPIRLAELPVIVEAGFSWLAGLNGVAGFGGTNDLGAVGALGILAGFGWLTGGFGEPAIACERGIMGFEAGNA